eukprot:CAMPEP_0116146184 /NCGR_PEP_ID=MMETSP0329-20121206/17027_1 /TAXON_ID=697910 /ORGANISM="Pseudo-nitzschia arenysensis, Strain B593" /LENGTH=737 /DNA_ID=CAMNT_0003641911 /DNA_START=97 /DNA_END=2310 /DNA_ORIENTATION=+
MSEISAEEALLKAKEIAARLTGASDSGPTVASGGVPSETVPAVTAKSERKRKRWGSAPTTESANNSSGATGFSSEAIPGLSEAKKQAAAKPSGPSSKRVWVPTTRERPETHFASFLKELLPELSAKINCGDFNGDDQNLMELGGRGASTVIVYGMPLEPMHVTIKGSDAFIAAAAPRLEELLAEGERAEREGPPPDESADVKAIEGDKDKYSSSALTLTRPYYQGVNAKSSLSQYRPATVAQLISGNPDVLGDFGSGAGDGNVELIEESIRIPNGIVGFIIGRGGETISSMQARSGCKVQIQKEHELQPGQTERVITLQAVKQESIDQCREIIESMVRDRVRSAGGNGRSAAGGSGSGGDYYGRSGAGVGGRTDNTEAKVQEALAEGHQLVKVEVPDADVGLVIGKGGSTIKYIQETTGSSVQIPHAADPGNPTVRFISITCPTAEGAESAKTQILNIIKNKPTNHHKGNNGHHNNSMNQNAASLEVSIPNKDVGLCIGRQGCVIKQLQSKTNTRIDIPPHPPPGQNIRVIRVTGPTQEACEMAKSFIERIVNEQSSSCVMFGSSNQNNNHNNYNRHGGAGIGYQNHYRNNQNNNNGGGNQNSAQSNDPAWQAYYAAQAIANNKQQQQQQQQAAAAVAAPASDAYYEQFHRYSYYYGEEAARQYYGTWSPPVGTPNPYGVNPNGVTAPPPADSATAPATSAAPAPSAPQATAPVNTGQVRDSSVRKVSNLPAWMTKK